MVGVVGRHLSVRSSCRHSRCTSGSFRFATCRWNTRPIRPHQANGAARRRCITGACTAPPLHAVGYIQGWRHPAQGYCGGRPGAGNRYVVNEGLQSELEVLEACYNVFLPTESILFSQSGGGGGWGDPRNRDPQAVLDDVLDEVVSLPRAHGAITAW